MISIRLVLALAPARVFYVATWRASRVSVRYRYAGRADAGLDESDEAPTRGASTRSSPAPPPPRSPPPRSPPSPLRTQTPPRRPSPSTSVLVVPP